MGSPECTVGGTLPLFDLGLWAEGDMLFASPPGKEFYLQFVPWCTGGDQRITFENQFLPSARWFVGVELRLFYAW